jgi:hypothetical protein
MLWFGTPKVPSVIHAGFEYSARGPELDAIALGAFLQQRRATRWGPSPTHSRSIRSSAVRARVSSAGIRHFISVAGNAARLLEEWKRGNERSAK